MTTTTDTRTAPGNDTGIDGGNGTQTAEAATGTPTPDVSPVEVGGAVWGALCAEPGASVAAIATAAGVPVPAARRALVALEAAGHARRTSGGRRDGKRAPDAWHPASTPDTTGTDTPAPDAATLDTTATDATGTAPEKTEATGETGTHTGTPAEVGVASDDTELGADTSDGDGDTGTDPADAPASDTTPAGATTPAHNNGRADERNDEGDGEGARMDPAAVTEARAALTGLGEAIASALSALQAGDRQAALAAAETFYSASGKGRRLVRAAAHRRARGASGVAHSAPGELRTKVAAHLAAHPGKEFTPHEIAKVIGHSAGAIANALDRLAALGQAIETCERPRRFTATAATTTASGAAGTATT